jgi:glutamate-5-semialdehyde dehydrogenase
MKTDLNKIREAAITLASLSDDKRNLFLNNLSLSINNKKHQILNANKIDVSNALKNKLSQSFVQRLAFDLKTIDSIQKRIKDVKRLKSNIGEIIEERKNNNGIKFQKVRVPIGVMLVIYESRPEVTIDVATLCVKSGNSVILKGGSEARFTNEVLYKCIKTALNKSGLPKEAVHMILSRDQTRKLLTKDNDIDLVIARGSYGMVKSVLDNSKIPVLAHASGGARIFVDKSADLAMAEKIIINSKISKPSACNSLDTIVVHQDIAEKFIPKIVSALKSYDVKIIGDSKVNCLIKVKTAKHKDWDTEFLGLTISIKIVKNLTEALLFINLHSKKHSEGVIAKNKKVIQYFTSTIDCAAIFVNCSPRLHDGYVFGLGSEMGIATGKLHARGPVGLKELTTYKWKIYGKGNIR